MKYNNQKKIKKNKKYNALKKDLVEKQNVLKQLETKLEEFQHNEKSIKEKLFKK